jgi:hypothetical protein
MTKKTKVYFYSMIPWENKLLHRAHMLAKYFDKLNMETYYVQRKPTFNLLNLFKKPLVTSDGLINVVNIYALPYVRGRSKFVFKLNDIILKKAYKHIIDKDGKMIIQTPHWGKSVVKYGVKKSNIFYDISDDYLDFTDSLKWRTILKDYEEFICDKANKVFISSLNLAVKSTQNKTIYIENGVDIDSFSGAKPVIESKKKVIGFIGGIFDWIDFDLIDLVCSIFTDNEIALIGPTNHFDKIETLNKHKNFTYYGEVDKKEIANYFASFDVGIIPFLSTDDYPRLKTVNSNKVYQYLYFGYPVVSTSFPQVDELKNEIYVSKTKEKFITNIKEALSEDSDLSQKRKLIAQGNSWESIAKKMINEI